ncbi:kinetochore Sim4 complex subunit Fta4 [Dipodascopsis tothii]|uniref:kinetochore Sim4 complex subunit Fta4 n=1 Tax=Dipodascopsis tothii TaxID=44089 RepID=UPI0034CD1D8E
MSAPPSLYDDKKAFLESQIRLLLRPLRPSREWTEQNQSAEQSLSSASVSAALYKLSLAQKRHSKQTQSSQALQHVAIQLDALHRASADQRTDAHALAWLSVADQVLTGQADLTDHDYEVLLGKLQSLSSAIAFAKKRHAHLRRLRELSETLREPERNVQPNLAARDGDLLREIDRMRVLVARVSAKLALES